MVESMLMMESPLESPILLKGRTGDLVVAGYASVEMVDKQGDLITKNALREAFNKFMGSPGFRNVQLAHSNIQVGSVVPEYSDSNGRVWKSEVDDTGMFVVIQLRDDIEKAREVAAEIRKGNLKSFSIGGQAFERVNKNDSERGDYREIRRMELHEVTICEKGINPEAQFRILKQDNTETKKGEKMTDAMSELQNVLERLSKRLDDSDEAEVALKATTDKAEKGDDKEAKEKSDDTEKAKKEKDDDEKSDDKSDKMDKSDEMDDIISTEYLQWLESTVKSAGYNPTAARGHFDEEGVEKAYLQEGAHGYDHRGQGSIEGAGEDDSGKRPKMDMGAGPSGNKTVIKADEYISSESVSSSQIEEAYQVYKAAAIEQRFKTDLGNEFSMRLQKEISEVEHEQARSGFDARGPLHDLQKAVLNLADRIENVSSVPGVDFQKSATSAGETIVIPETTEMAAMSWDDVHRLAGRAMSGGEN
jgi:HK97 family phage prohead protease|tara:strand:- start:8119 stop:9543 length:1425 start_codon:yes stop_codon:yes gene_type:complete